jgi:hypothetical protein
LVCDLTDAGDKELGSESVNVVGGLKLMPRGTDAGDNRNPWCMIKGKGFIPPGLKPLAGLDERAGCHLVPYPSELFIYVLGRELRRELGERLGLKLGPELRSVRGTTLGTELGAPLGSRLGTELIEALGSTLGAALEDGLCAGKLASGLDLCILNFRYYCNGDRK